jgi:enamine deaminase RidA (YjgF/YER057c/UK114 family)
MGPEHIVKVTQYLTDAKYIAAYGPIRTRWLKEHRPASMLLVVPALVWPKLLIEIEIYAVAP